MALKVEDQSPEVTAAAQNWPIFDALLGGTAAMRQFGARYLPLWPNEEPLSHRARINAATLFPALNRTITVMSGKPFSKQVTLGDDVPAQIEQWCEDVDLQGNNLHSFAAEIMPEMLAYGFCGVLVDYPRVGDSIKTQADEQQSGVRPYAVLVTHSQILGWKIERQGGAVALTQLRLAETAEVPDGDFGTTIKSRVRVLTPGAYVLYEKQQNDQYLEIESGTTAPLNVIPFVPFYGRKLGPMRGISPLLDLAYLNVKHWQSQSDQDTILHVARVPILAAIGVDSDTWQLTVGASTAVKLPIGADLKFVEHSGKAIAAGETALQKLEEQMIQTGAELLVIKPQGQQKTATQANNEAEANRSELQRIVENFEDSLDQMLQLMAEWVGEPEGGHVSLFKDFGANTLTDASAQLVLAMQAQGLISKETAIREQQRRGMLSADVVPEDEIEAVDAEGPVLGIIGGPKMVQAIEPKVEPVDKNTKVEPPQPVVS